MKSRPVRLQPVAKRVLRNMEQWEAEEFEMDVHALGRRPPECHLPYRRVTIIVDFEVGYEVRDDEVVVYSITRPIA